MDTSQILNITLYIIPAIITGLVAYYFFKEHLKNETEKRNFILKQKLQNKALPSRLQAYERLTLFLERIKPANLLTRIAPISEHKNDYEALLFNTISQEFDHNLTQQIYVSEACWNAVILAKNATIQTIRKANLELNSTQAEDLRTAILNAMGNQVAPSQIALSIINEEVNRLW